MESEFNVYCDESCHLEHDGISIMAMGSMYCEKKNVQIFLKKIKEIKIKNNISTYSEIKWNKISPCNKNFYIDLLNCFFECEGLFFRGYVAQGKDSLDHKRFFQDYNTWYYKIYYRMLEYIINTDYRYNIYIDIKDTVGGEKVKELQKYLNMKFGLLNPVDKIQIVDSKECSLLQLSDVFAGALSYSNRHDIPHNGTKNEICDFIRANVGSSLTSSTSLAENKANWFLWSGR